MSLTGALAIIGATTGITGATLGLASFFRDRPRVIVSHNSVSGPTREGRVDMIRVYVINGGRQPIAIVGAGLMEHTKHGLGHRVSVTCREVLGLLLAAVTSRGYISVSAWQSWPALSETDEPVVLQPGDLRKFLLIAESVEDKSLPRPDVYSYATDFGGNNFFSPTPIFLRANWVPVAEEPVAFFGDGSENEEEQSR